jgi:uncharacterized RDD family membrane protein YckC
VARERVITGEAVEVELPIARLATRTIAILVDAAVELLFGVVPLILAITVLVGSNVDSALIGAIAIVGVVVIFLVYPVTLETLTRGRSLGKLVMGLRVVRDDGGPVRFRHAFVRGLVGLVIEWPGLPFAPLSWIFGAGALLFNSKGKRIGDLAAGTMVLQERLPDRGRFVAQMPPPLAPWALTLDLTRVDDDLAMTVRQFLSRAHELRAEPRTRLGQQLVNEVMAVTAPAPPPGTSGWWYLAAVLAERRRREELRLASQRTIVALGPSPYARPARPPAPVTPAPVLSGTGPASATGYEAPA